MANETKTNSAVKTSETTNAKQVNTLSHKGGKSWELNGRAISNVEAMQFMRANHIDVPVWLEREVRTGKTLEERRAAKLESAIRRQSEKTGIWRA